jgi:hypothetical protein
MISLTQLPKEGYIVEFPYDPEVDTIVIVSIIPYTSMDWDCITRHKDGILAIKQRMSAEDDYSFKMRLEDIIQKIRRQRGLIK